MRSRFGHNAIETLNQQHYNHRYGTSNGEYDLLGYKILSHVDVAITSNSIDESVEDHFLHGLEDEYKSAREFYKDTNDATKLIELSKRVAAKGLATISSLPSNKLKLVSLKTLLPYKYPCAEFL